MLVDERSRVSCSLTSGHVTSLCVLSSPLVVPSARSQGSGWLILIAVPFSLHRIVTLSPLPLGFVLKPRDRISEIHIIRDPRIW